MLKKLVIATLPIFLCQFVYAQGVSLGTTRVFYPIGAKQAAIRVYNSDTKNNYLVQSWVTDAQNKKTSDFIVTPPLFVMKANTNNTLRIVYTGDKNSLPQDRETLFYFNSKVIPSMTEKDASNNSNKLFISTTSKIKLFMRPANFTVEQSTSAYKKITCSYENNQVKIENPTPFYINMVSLRINNKEVSTATIVAPMGPTFVKTSQKGSKLVFNLINDYGAQEENRECLL